MTLPLLGCGGAPDPVPDSDTRVVSITSFNDASMAIFSDGTVRCWGNNVFANCALGAGGVDESGFPVIQDQYDYPVLSPELSSVAQISQYAGALVQKDGTVQLWLGPHLRRPAEDVPNGVVTDAADVPPARAVVGDDYSIFVVGSDDDIVYYWGNYRYSMRNDVDTISVPNPTKYPGAPRAKAIDMAVRTCIIDFEDRIWCWGPNRDGDVGEEPGEMEGRIEPLRVEGMPPASAIETGLITTCAVARDDGAVYCWGQGRSGLMGEALSNTYVVASPQRIEGLSNVVQVDVAEYTACAVTKDHALYCWGSNNYSFFGANDAERVWTPIELPEAGSVVQVAVDGASICARRTDHTVWCVGRPGSIGRGQDPSEKWGPVDFSKTTSVPEPFEE